MKIAVVLNSHQNSPLFLDTLDSVKTYLSKDIFILIDGSYCEDFKSLDYNKILGFRHGENISEIVHSRGPTDERWAPREYRLDWWGRSKAPYRNVALGLSKTYEVYKDSVDWYCYLESDCLITSDRIVYDLYDLLKEDYWIVGNDVRSIKSKIKIINYFLGDDFDELKYCLGCCVFYNSKFIKKLYENNFFEKFLYLTNFYSEHTCGLYFGNSKNAVFDISEYLYPTLAHYYGGKIKELNSWSDFEKKWKKNNYMMRWKPDINENEQYKDSFILHPIKEFLNPVRQYYKNKRNSSFYI
jgi:hypothetical protein